MDSKNHYKGSLFNNQDSMESKAVFFLWLMWSPKPKGPLAAPVHRQCDHHHPRGTCAWVCSRAHIGGRENLVEGHLCFVIHPRWWWNARIVKDDVILVGWSFIYKKVPVPMRRCEAWEFPTHHSWALTIYNITLIVTLRITLFCFHCKTTHVFPSTKSSRAGVTLETLQASQDGYWNFFIV